MSDSIELLEGIETAEDAFGHAHGRPTFDPKINSSTDASDGEVQIQKACHLLELTHEIDELGEYYGAILEHSFIVIEHTLQGYLLAMTGADASELRNHTSPYEFAKGQVPLEESTIDSLKALYDTRRTKHYYGTTVTTQVQARSMRTVASNLHEHIVTFDHDIEQYCLCSASE
jgi:hypothetical protein